MDPPWPVEAADGTIRLWDVVSRQEKATLPLYTRHWVYSVSFSPGGAILGQWEQ